MELSTKVSVYLTVIGFTSEHLRCHPKGRAHQRELPTLVLDLQLHHFPSQAKVSH